jgi:8-oxo-dGTP diphosphatase
MTTFATLCYVHSRGRVLLLRKARGLFGGGKWNAPGGKMQSSELPEKAAVRETREETGLRVNNLHFRGILNFYLGDSRDLDQTVFVFFSDKFAGKLRGGREGELKWCPIDQMPYDEMWEDDRIWLPLLLEGKSFVGDFHFTENYGKLLSHQIYQTVDNETHKH